MGEKFSIGHIGGNEGPGIVKGMGVWPIDLARIERGYI